MAKVKDMQENKMEEDKEALKRFLEESEGFQKMYTVNDKIVFYLQSAKEFSQTYIRSLLLINGGALVLLPALLTSWDNAISDQIYWAAAFFTAGLIFTIFSSRSYVLVSEYMTDASENKREYMISLILMRYSSSEEENSEEEKKAQEQDLKEIEKSEVQHKQNATTFDRWASLFAGLATVCFIAGSTFLIVSLKP